MNNVTNPVAPGPALRMPGVVYPPADQLAQYVAAGYLGRKSGRGFYDYAKDSK